MRFQSLFFVSLAMVLSTSAQVSVVVQEFQDSSCSGGGSTNTLTSDTCVNLAIPSTGSFIVDAISNADGCFVHFFLDTNCQLTNSAQAISPVGPLTDGQTGSCIAPAFSSTGGVTTVSSASVSC